MEIRENHFTVEREGTVLACRSFETDTSVAKLPVVFIHGALVDGTFFERTARELARTRLAIVYDRRGCGESSNAADENYDTAAQALDAAAIIERVGAPCDVIAHSAGTIIAVELAATRPELVSRMILHEPPLTGGVAGDSPDLRREVTELVSAGRYSRAVARFMLLCGDRDERAPAATDAETLHATRNCMTFIRREYLGLVDHVMPLDAARDTRITVGVGELSRGSARWDEALGCADGLGCPIAYFPGAHNCARDLPREFAWLCEGILASGDTGTT